MNISKFLSYHCLGTIDPKIPSPVLTKIIPIEGEIEFLGAIRREYNMFSETSILYKFPKYSTGVGHFLKTLGTLIEGIPLEAGVDFGIDELDVTRPDGYYILFYLMEEMRDQIEK